MAKRVLSKTNPLPAEIIEASLDVWLASLPTSWAGLAVGKWWNNGGIPTKVTANG